VRAIDTLSVGAVFRAVGVIGAAALAVAGCASENTSVRPTSEAANYNLQLGVAYLQQGDLATAKDKLERARTQDPHSAGVHSALALLDERLGDDKKADAEYRTAQELTPADPELQNNYAVFLCGKGRVDEGVKRFEQAGANRLYRTPWAAYTNAGVCLRSAHRNGEAEAHFERALAVRPDYAEAVFQLADLEFTLQHQALARSRIDIFLMRNPPTADLLLLAWRIAEDQMDQPGAERYAQRLAKEFPNSDQARAVGAAAPAARPGNGS
jgi:type IV pilus assembly protein PilF